MAHSRCPVCHGPGAVYIRCDACTTRLKASHPPPEQGGVYVAQGGRWHRLTHTPTPIAQDSGRAIIFPRKENP
jgi:hypothetical protein